jgi:hypothetical protein
LVWRAKNGQVFPLGVSANCSQGPGISCSRGNRNGLTEMSVS